MDIAAGATGQQRAKGRVATVAIEAKRFHAPILVGDLVLVYTKIISNWSPSLTMHVETWVRRQRTDQLEMMKAAVALYRCRLRRTELSSQQVQSPCQHVVGLRH